jgi:UDP-glucose 4-epimerase
MKILVTGSSGHLGEALVRTLRAQHHEVVSMDVLSSPFTTTQGSILDRELVRRSMSSVEAVIHTATLHKPHVATHSRQQFVDTNITGTLNLLEEAIAARVSCFIFTSTTSTFGRALSPPIGAPAAWITEEVAPVPKNIYGATKTSAETLCELFSREHNLPCLILKTSRFFPEEDDNDEMRAMYQDDNSKANEFLYRRVEIEDVVSAHLRALERAASIKFGKYIISATTPFTQEDLAALRVDAPQVVKHLFPEYEAIYASLGWKMFPSIDRVYVNAKARNELGWEPSFDFSYVLRRLLRGEGIQSSLARTIGVKGYHRNKMKQ